MTTPPDTETKLMEYAESISGKTIQHIARITNTSIPENIKSSKGWVGELIEKSLGATAGNLSVPDFPQLGIELKTIPVKENNKPKESTFVCNVPLTGHEISWNDSSVKSKLSRVLWIPVEAIPSIPFEQRRVGSAFLWRLSANDEKILKADWEELMDMVNMGQISNINASYGQYLQIRPKAANAQSLRRGIDENGDITMTLPRGFYLRTVFTKKILESI